MTPIQEKILRSALFVVCNSKEELHRWIKIYLGIDIPNVIICDDEVHHPPSNSCPMDLIWEIYSKGIEGTDPKFQEILAYSARDAFKTLSASIIELLCLVHLKRDVVHLAAIEPQAGFCLAYVKKFLSRPILRDYMTSPSRRGLSFAKYVDSDGNIISPVQYNKLPAELKNNYSEQKNKIHITVATVEACNGLHAPFMCMDELDIAPPDAFMEAKSIPAATEDRKLPITFYTSTRKYSYGLVQKEIDRSYTEKTDLNIRHWNYIDVTERCPPKRHLPEEPKIDIYVYQDTLTAISEEEYHNLPETEKKNYEKVPGYAGCLKNCKLFSVCKGRLATKQTSNSPLLKRIDQTQSNIRKVSLEHAKAQYMTWKPSTAGLVYPFFSREIHEKSAHQIAEIFTGDKFSPNMSKNDLINLLKKNQAQFFSGIDWGFTHNFVVVTGAVIAHYLFILDVIAAPELELPDMLDVTKKQIGHLSPIMFPDNAYPANVKSFRSAGFACIDFHKDVLEGVKSVRERLTPGLGKRPNMYFLKDDVGVDGLIKELQIYHWKLDKAGNLMDEPDKVEDDRCDALRYLCQNVQLNKSRFIIGVDTNSNIKKNQDQNALDTFLKNKINELVSKTNDINEDGEVIEDPSGAKFLF